MLIAIDKLEKLATKQLIPSEIITEFDFVFRAK